MNNTKAISQAIDNKRTWGELLAILDGSNKSGLCAHNKGMTRERAADTMIAQIIKQDDMSVVPEGTAYNKSMGKNIMSNEGMLIMNVLKEFG